MSLRRAGVVDVLGDFDGRNIGRRSPHPLPDSLDIPCSRICPHHAEGLLQSARKGCPLRHVRERSLEFRGEPRVVKMPRRDQERGDRGSSDLMFSPLVRDDLRIASRVVIHRCSCPPL